MNDCFPTLQNGLVPRGRGGILSIVDSIKTLAFYLKVWCDTLFIYYLFIYLMSI